MTQQVSFHVTRDEAILIGKIIDRAIQQGIRVPNRMEAHMDISATIAQGCPLKLQEWLNCESDFDFAHDFCGIGRHIDRKTGQLMDCFLPRFSGDDSASPSASQSA